MLVLTYRTSQLSNMEVALESFRFFSLHVLSIRHLDLHIFAGMSKINTLMFLVTAKYPTLFTRRGRARIARLWDVGFLWGGGGGGVEQWSWETMTSLQPATVTTFGWRLGVLTSPADDVHNAQNNQGAGGWGIRLREDEKGSIADTDISTSEEMYRVYSVCLVGGRVYCGMTDFK